jgi:hypothetical protein
MTFVHALLMIDVRERAWLRSLPNRGRLTTALWVESCGCLSVGSSARGVAPSLPDPRWCKGLAAGATRARLWNCVGSHCISQYLPFLPFYRISLSGVPVLISVSYLISIFFSLCFPEVAANQARSIEGAEIFCF